MISTWTDCAGRTVGNWRLESLLGVRDETAYYIGKHESAGTTMLIQMMQAGTERGEAVRDSWELARTFEHPHVMRIFDSGDAWIDDSHLHYAATEVPDDDVAEMQGRGKVPKEQARRIAEQAGQALEYLHAHGLCQGGVHAGAIFLVGDLVKLGVDTLRPVTEACRAKDMQQLWEIFPVQEPDAVPEEVPEVRTSPLAMEQTVPPRARLPWAVVGVAGGAVLALLMGYRSWSHSTSAEPAATPAPLAAAAPRNPTPAVMKPSPVQTRARVTNNSSGAWAVVSATYSSYGSAEKRAISIGQQVKRIKPHVYPQEGKGGLYYVVLGSGLSQKDADKLRRTAVQNGAPRDSYVTKLIER